MQAQGLKKRLLSTGCKTAVVGISGGLDSTLALLVTVRAIELLKRPHRDITAVSMPCFGTTDRTRKNAAKLCAELGVSFHEIDITAAVTGHCPHRDITAVSMPCFGTTDRTRKNAAKLCAELGVSFHEIDITAAVTGHLADLGHDPHIADITYENAQARERTQLLMDLANQTDGLVVGTGDLSELALGWATYNGDHMSMYAVNASVPKTLVCHLVSYVAEHSRKRLKSVLEDILSTPVSPELLPAKNGQIAQKTEDLVGPYALHDFFSTMWCALAFPRQRSAFWPSAPLPKSTGTRRSYAGCGYFTSAFSLSSLSGPVCPTAPRWARLPCRPGGIGGCPAMPVSHCGNRSSTHFKIAASAKKHRQDTVEDSSCRCFFYLLGVTLFDSKEAATTLRHGPAAALAGQILPRTGGYTSRGNSRLFAAAVDGCRAAPPGRL